METIHFPSQLQIEVVAGYCTADCIMCEIKKTTRKGFLSLTNYAQMLDKFAMHLSKIKFLTLQGLGEPLLDKTLVDKITMAKKIGFSGIGFSTNATLLTETMSERLIQSGLDTIIFSIDGIKKTTHEYIRRGTNFEQIVNNVNNFIKIRNNIGATKIIVRMVRQETNNDEWEEYKEYWSKQLNDYYDDKVSVFDVHNWGGHEENTVNKELQKLAHATKLMCPDLIERMVVLLNGEIALCNGDEFGPHHLGNIFRDDPKAIYNGPIYSEYRKMMSEGRLTDIAYCRNCSIIVSRMKKEYLDICSISKNQN